MLDKAEYSAFESTLNSAIVSYRIVLIDSGHRVGHEPVPVHVLQFVRWRPDASSDPGHLHPGTLRHCARSTGRRDPHLRVPGARSQERGADTAPGADEAERSRIERAG